MADTTPGRSTPSQGAGSVTRSRNPGAYSIGSNESHSSSVVVGSGAVMGVAAVAGAAIGVVGAAAVVGATAVVVVTAGVTSGAWTVVSTRRASSVELTAGPDGRDGVVDRSSPVHAPTTTPSIISNDTVRRATRWRPTSRSSNGAELRSRDGSHLVRRSAWQLVSAAVGPRTARSGGAR